MLSLRNLYLFALVFIIGGVIAKQAVPFDPIHPGTLHADRFSPLTGDSVNVNHFQGMF